MARTGSSGSRPVHRPVAAFSNSICLTSWTAAEASEIFATNQAAQGRSTRTRSRASLSASSSADSLTETTVEFVSHAAGLTIELQRPASGLPGVSTKGCADKRTWCFTLDDIFSYSSFASDFGPLNFAFVYRFCMLMHEIEADARFSNALICIYTSEDPKQIANLACLVALYMVLVKGHKPWSAFEPLMSWSLPPFIHAGAGTADFGLSIQDCLWGIWKARQENLLDMELFEVENYEYYEQPRNGDLNTVGPFVAFASPFDPEYVYSKGGPVAKPKDVEAGRKAFEKAIKYFKKESVKLVFRLNEDTYDREDILATGIAHEDMPFTDGSNPSSVQVRKFISLADKVISAGGKVAVHCKAGLGRTGCLIGAYLIYKHGFTPSAVIGFMRLIRPGMVVGPQQNWLILNHADCIRWSAEDAIRRQLAAERQRALLPSDAPNTPKSMPASLLAIYTPSRTPSSISAAADNLKTPGQRKSTWSCAECSVLTQPKTARKTPARSREPTRAVAPLSPSKGQASGSPARKRSAELSPEAAKSSKIPRRSGSGMAPSRATPGSIKRAPSLPAVDDVFGSSPIAVKTVGLVLRAKTG